MFFFKNKPMKAIIQQNLTSGLGDFISDVSQYMSTFKELKKEGYKVNLKISLNSNKYVIGPFFRRLFDSETCNFFDTIEETPHTIHQKQIDDYTYFCSNHHPQTPGIHHFDVFFDVIPNNYKSQYIHATKIKNESVIPDLIPQPSDEIIEKVNIFWNEIPNQDYCFLHIRTSDIIDHDTIRYDNIINRVENHIIKTNDFLHLGTNNKYIYNTLKNNKNIITFKFDEYDKISNDMNAFNYGLNHLGLSEHFLCNRTINIFSEMVSVIKAKKIYIINDHDWTSNFLFYPLAKIKNKIETINL